MIGVSCTPTWCDVRAVVTDCRSDTEHYGPFQIQRSLNIIQPTPLYVPYCRVLHCIIIITMLYNYSY